MMKINLNWIISRAVNGFISECFIEEPYAGKPHVRFCGGFHDIETLNVNNFIME